MKTQLLENEVIIKTGKANLLRGIEAVGGSLYLTNTRLIFEPHAVNVQVELEVINLSDVSLVSLGWTKLLGVFPVYPNVIRVSARGLQFDFTVYGRKKWQAKLSEILAK
jgi:hypothetical protein